MKQFFENKFWCRIFGFSKILPSAEVWKILSSTEKGGAPFLSLGIGILFFFAYLIKSALDCNFHSLQGAIVLTFFYQKKNNQAQT